MAEKRKGAAAVKKQRFFVFALAAAALLWSCSSQKTNISKAEVDLIGIRISLARYAMHDGRHPTTEQGLRALVTKPALPPKPAKWEGPYLALPDLQDPWGNEYVYISPGTHDPENYPYDLYSCGPNGRAGGDDDVTIWAMDGRFQ